jgi:molybdopterin converting factor small subunit
VTVRVAGFAQARELLADSATLELSEPACVADVWSRLVEKVPAMRELGAVRFAVGGAIVAPDRRLHDGDEVAVLPPVGGG